MQNRVFFPQSAFDQWIIDGTIDLAGSELTIVSEGRRYQVAEAVQVITEVTGTKDDNELLGKVKTKAFLEELGAEILEGSMILGDNAYDVKPGWMGIPIGTFEEHLMERNVKSPPPRNEEDLLTRALATPS